MEKPLSQHVCPFWVGYLLANPLRKLIQNPEEILKPFVQEGMTVLDVGSAMGFFTLPMARMVEPAGKVYAADVQEKMLKSLEKRARKAGVSAIIEPRHSLPETLDLQDLNGKIDFALAFAVAHEMPDAARLFSELAVLLKPSGKILLAEPKGHVNAAAFQETLAIAENHAFAV